MLLVLCALLIVSQIRPTEEELKEMGPEFNELFDRYFRDKPDKVSRIFKLIA